MPREFLRDYFTKIDEWVEKKIHNLWCSETLLFIPALKGIPKELIARASPIKATSPGAIRKQQQQQQQTCFKILIVFLSWSFIGRCLLSLHF